MFRLWKGRKDAENKTNNLNEKNTHEIKSQIENDGTNGTDLDKPGSHLIDLRHILHIIILRVAKIQKKHNYWLRISLIYTLPAEMQFIHLTILAKIQSHSIFSRKNQWCF